MIPGLVTTIIPVHNRAALLKESVESVLAQTYPKIEIIIVDDGSTDDTANVADDYARNYPSKITAIHQSNTGPGLAREAGRLRARGEFIQYLDSDDVLLPRKFELQVAGLNAHSECGVSYGKTRFSALQGNRSEVAWKRTGERIQTMFPAMLESRWWGTSTPLYRKELTDKVGPWTTLVNEEDWEYDCRIAAQGVYLDCVSEFISEERDHDGQRLSRNGTKQPRKLEDRAVAHSLILGHAMKAGITSDVIEMQRFARELFLISRQCGAAGLREKSEELFSLAKAASGIERAQRLDFRLYELLANVTGWCVLGKIACYSDSVRK